MRTNGEERKRIVTKYGKGFKAWVMIRVKRLHLDLLKQFIW